MLISCTIYGRNWLDTRVVSDRMAEAGFAVVHVVSSCQARVSPYVSTWINQLEDAYLWQDKIVKDNTRTNPVEKRWRVVFIKNVASIELNICNEACKIIVSFNRFMYAPQYNTRVSKGNFSTVLSISKPNNKRENL